MISEILFEQKINREREVKARANLDQFLILVHDVLYLEIDKAIEARRVQGHKQAATAHLTCFGAAGVNESFTGGYFPLVAWTTYRLQQHSNRSFMIGITVDDRHWSLHWTGSRGIAYRAIDRQEADCGQDSTAAFQPSAIPKSL